MELRVHGVEREGNRRAGKIHNIIETRYNVGIERSKDAEVTDLRIVHDVRSQRSGTRSR